MEPKPEREPEREPDHAQLDIAAADIAGMEGFEHDRLDMYKAAIEFLALADTIAGELPRGRAYLADQLRRAATAITLNIAEGAGGGAILDVARTLSLSAVAPLRHGRAILLRIVAMLTGAILKLTLLRSLAISLPGIIDSGSDSGSRSGSKDADTAAETQQPAPTQ